MKNLSGIKIAVSGKSGCGNSTVSRLLAEKLGLKLINYTFHDMAEEAGIPFEEFCRRAENDPSYDYALDDRQIRLAQNGGVVLGSRLAVWLLKDADLKVYLYAPAEIRSGRVHRREGGCPREHGAPPKRLRLTRRVPALFALRRERGRVAFPPALSRK